MARTQQEVWNNDVAEFFRLSQGQKIAMHFASLRSLKYFGMQNLYDAFSEAKQIAHDKNREEGLKMLMWSLKVK